MFTSTISLKQRERTSISGERTGYATKVSNCKRKYPGYSPFAIRLSAKVELVSLIVGNFTTLTAPGAVLILKLISPVARQAPDLPIL